MQFTQLMLDQLDEQLKMWDIIKKQQIPKRGWINLIRTSLGLSTRKLAKRMGVNQPRVVKIESAELNETVTLKTLKKAAEAMGCKLVYGIIPQETLHNV